ncbi:hypothetical protein [Streptomyces sp. NPDC014685]|uniref:hypothetical protein n=1 Tax=Streptomyces sp. NPDC014685 TaxID=3364881 RepID=UPI003702AD99
MRSSRPLTGRGSVFVRVAIAFVLLVSLGGGLGLAVEGFEGRAALRAGPVGSLVPTDRTCGKESCTWIGTFTSADGAVTAHDVELRDATDVGRVDPAPARIDGVRLAEDAGAAYTADYAWHGPVVNGAVLALVGLAVATGLVLKLRRHRASAASARTAGYA